jgi:hypothetical protein
MQLESEKRKDQEYFAAWDKQIESSSMCIVTNLATLVFIFIVMNILILAMLGELSLFNLQF